jgi:hypothetical protein
MTACRPIRKGHFGCSGMFLSCPVAPRLIRPPNLFPNFHTNDRSTIVYAWNMTIPNMQDTKNLIPNLSRLTSAKGDSQ